MIFFFSFFHFSLRGRKPISQLAEPQWDSRSQKLNSGYAPFLCYAPFGHSTQFIPDDTGQRHHPHAAHWGLASWTDCEIMGSHSRESRSPTGGHKTSVVINPLTLLPSLHKQEGFSWPGCSTNLIHPWTGASHIFSDLCVFQFLGVATFPREQCQHKECLHSNTPCLGGTVYWETKLSSIFVKREWNVLLEIYVDRFLRQVHRSVGWDGTANIS